MREEGHFPPKAPDFLKARGKKKDARKGMEKDVTANFPHYLLFSHFFFNFNFYTGEKVLQQ